MIPSWMSYDKFVKDLRPALELFNSSCNTLDLPENVRKNALALYKQLIAKSLTEGRRRKLMLCASAYISCKEMNYPVNIPDLCKAFECKKTEMIRAMKFINEHVKTGKEMINPGEYVNRYCYELMLDEKKTTKSLKELDKTRAKLENKSSQAVAAATVYTANKDKTSIRKIQRLTGVSKTCITNCLKILKKEKTKNKND